MVQKYDAAAKFFANLRLRDWMTLINTSSELEIAELEELTVGPEVEELDSDVSTVSARVDKLMRVGGKDPRIEHVEVQTFRDVRVPVRLCRYGVVVHYVRGLPVNSTVILLHPSADGPELTGLYVAKSADGTPFLQYRYRVIRIWEIPVEVLLRAGIGVLVFAPLCKIDRDALPALIAQMRVRVERELPPSEQAEFWGGMGILMGLAFDVSFIDDLLKGTGNMRGSSYAQLLIKEGREEGLYQGRKEEAQKNVLRVALRRFGSVDARLQLMVDSSNDLTQLEQLLDFAISSQNVDELLTSIDRVN